MSRILRLTLVAPEIVEAIRDGRQSAWLQLDDLLEAFPLEWEEQQRRLKDTAACVEPIADEDRSTHPHVDQSDL